MFVGHYSASLAAKAIDPRIPLGVLFLAAQAVDILWCVLLLAGVERVDMVPGFTATNDFDLVYVPYTHSLAATIGWAALALVVWSVGRNRRGWGGSALVVALVVLSHWFADLISHTPDLPLYGDQHKQGLGLWNHLYANLALEVGLVAVALVLYYRSTHRTERGGNLGMVLFVAAMCAMQVAALFGPRPETARETAATGLACYLGFALAAEYFDRKRSG